jgi:hypothetical protein
MAKHSQQLRELLTAGGEAGVVDHLEFEQV